MNKKTVSITSLVAGILVATVALFYVITGILVMTNFNANNGAKVNWWFAIEVVLLVGAAAILGIFSYLTIRNYVRGAEEYQYGALAAICVLGMEFLMTFISMCFWGFDSAKAWVLVVLDIAGIVLILLPMFAKLEKQVGQILVLIGVGIGFIVSIVTLTGAGGIGIATDIFMMFMFIAIFLVYVFLMIINQGGQAEKKDSNESEKQASELE